MKSLTFLHNRKWLLVFFCSLIIFSSCKKFVDVQIPKTQLYTENTFNSNATATSALTAIYSQMQTSSDLLSYNISLTTGVSGDELFNYSTVAELLEFYQNNIQTINSRNQNLWSNLYKYIYQANSVILGLQNPSSGASPAVKTQLIGEAKFIRAFCLFFLTNLYGDIPIITSTDYNENKSVFRSSKSDVYDQIIADLQEAKTDLNSNYVSIDDTTVTTERVRPNKSAAASLLARAYLYKGDWANAEAEATYIISNTALYDTVSINNVFRAGLGNKEAIWQLQPVISGFNTLEGANFILIGAPAIFQTSNCTTVSSHLKNAFENGDLRLSKWIKDTTINSVTYSYPFKYKIRTGSTLTEYSMVLRVGEIYLIRAEARAQQDKISEALNDLNIIRKRAGLLNSTASTQSSLLDAISRERQVELFTEWGHRWFDLKRTDKIDAIMATVAASKGVDWNTNKQLLPIPQNERNNDLNLTQNDGYQ